MWQIGLSMPITSGIVVTSYDCTLGNSIEVCENKTPSAWLAVGAGGAVTAALFFGGTAAEHETITNEEILL